MVDINDFEQERTCTYKEEVYKVRDNGAVLRMTPEGKKARPLDNTWTYGTKNDSNGYMTIGGHRVHIIVATAFYGSRDSKVYVVDHIDTNRCNNRVENLRWLTRLENILLNDNTRQKIEFICGSVEEFLQNPSLLRGHENSDKNFEWMRTVTKEEAENTLKSWKTLMEKTRVKTNSSKHIGDWIYNKNITVFSDAIPQVHTSRKVPDDNHSLEKTVEEKRLHEEQEKKLKSEQKQNDTKEREKQKRKSIKLIKESIAIIAKSHGWIVNTNVSGNGWKADLVIEGPKNRLGFMLYKSTRSIEGKNTAMKAEGIKACWLGTTYSDYIYSDLLPCFDIDITDSHINAIISENMRVSLDELLRAMMSNRLKVEDKVSINKVKVRFVNKRCYWCNAEHYVYIVIGAVSDEFPSLESAESFMKYEIDIDELNPVIIKGVKRFLSEQPELKYNMGEIKKRNSRTMGEEYMSFGCPKCDGLFGSWYLDDIRNVFMYEPDDENVHVVNLEESLKINYKHWVII